MYEHTSHFLEQHSFEQSGRQKKNMIHGGKSWTIFAAVVVTFLASCGAEGYNKCLQKEVKEEVFRVADGCTPDEKGVLDLFGCDISNGDHEALTACLSVSPSTVLKIDLGGNVLSRLPEGLFTDMSNVKELSLLKNRAITTLPLGTFAGLKGLKYLHLGRMGLGSLPAGLFDDVKKLQILGLGDQGRGFTELPDGLFEGLLRLRRLVVNGNGISSLPAGIFSSNTRLSFLNLSDNPITFLPETIFNGLGLLHTISLTQSNEPGTDNDVRRLHLKELPAGLFAGLTTLKNVIIRGNLLKTLPQGLFDDTSRLKTINFSNNELIKVPENTFTDLPALIELDMSGNIYLQCKYEVDAHAPEDSIKWPAHLGNVSVGECLR